MLAPAGFPYLPAQGEDKPGDGTLPRRKKTTVDDEVLAGYLARHLMSFELGQPPWGEEANYSWWLAYARRLVKRWGDSEASWALAQSRPAPSSAEATPPAPPAPSA